MNVNMKVRYASGREDHFQVEIFGGGAAEFRLKDFIKDPTLVLKTEAELIIIPAHAIECVSLALPESEIEELPLKRVRKATRLG
ncbi:MAG TPA: hypothetical protein VKE24_05845 [Candidatus Acidoferrales bacterium]|nr:hypothetical protein [Candidatus Acidoferrales bacterium]